MQRITPDLAWWKTRSRLLVPSVRRSREEHGILARIAVILDKPTWWNGNEEQLVQDVALGVLYDRVLYALYHIRPDRQQPHCHHSTYMALTQWVLNATNQPVDSVDDELASACVAYLWKATTSTIPIEMRGHLGKVHEVLDTVQSVTRYAIALNTPSNQVKEPWLVDHPLAEVCFTDELLTPTAARQLAVQGDELSTSHQPCHCPCRRLINPSMNAHIRGKTKYWTAAPDAVLFASAADHMDAIKWHADTVTPHYGDGPLWIPSDFQVAIDGSVRILSYINNLHPREYSALYTSIEHVFAKMVPSFDRVCSRLSNARPEVHVASSQRPVDSSSFTLRGRRVHVVTELIDIRLTTATPCHPATQWHRDGGYRDIVATGLYLFDMENVHEPRLHFARRVAHDSSCNTEVKTQPVVRRGYESCGYVTLRNGRGVVYPGYLEHCLDSVELQDKSRMGGFKTLLFHVVFPNQYTVSTAEIPPQERKWILDDTVGLVVRTFDLFDGIDRLLEELVYTDPDVEVVMDPCHHKL